MAYNTSYEVHKLRVEIMREGMHVRVTRDAIDRFGEAEPGSERLVGEFDAIYHETSESVIGAATLVGFGGSVTRYEKIPMLLCVLADLPKERLEVGDWVYVNDTKYSFSGIMDLGDMGLVGDITLSILDTGGYI